LGRFVRTSLVFNQARAGDDARPALGSGLLLARFRLLAFLGGLFLLHVALSRWRSSFDAAAMRESTRGDKY
jgi:hypothetical protein